MRNLLLIIFFFSSPVFSCRFPISDHIIYTPEKYLDKHDLVVYAKLIRFIKITKEQQIAEFSISKIFKGSEVYSVIVHNYLRNSCSSALMGTNANYYLFLSKDNSANNYFIDSGTFVQVQNENAHQLNTKLSSHSKTFKSKVEPMGAP
ncbi:hypothetical protein ACVBE9_01635 [Eionea flava]